MITKETVAQRKKGEVTEVPSAKSRGTPLRKRLSKESIYS